MSVHRPNVVGLPVPARVARYNHRPPSPPPCTGTVPLRAEYYSSGFDVRWYEAWLTGRRLLGMLALGLPPTPAVRDVVALVRRAARWQAVGQGDRGVGGVVYCVHLRVWGAGALVQ